MKKKQIFWLVVVAIIIVALVFVKCAPFWVSINALVSFSVGVVVGGQRCSMTSTSNP